MKLAIGLPATLIMIFAFFFIGCENKTNPAESDDTTPPTVTATYPVNAAVDVPVDTVITAAFSEDINPTTIAASTFYLDGGVTGAVTYSNKKATFTPSSDLAEDQTYTATITTAVKDEAGNALAENHTWTFSTGSAVPTTPQVVSTYPADGGTGVPVDTVITATFNKDMNASTFTNSTFFLSSINGTVAYSGRTATLTPLADLQYNTQYTAYLLTAIQDTEGNSLPATYTWEFTTVPDVIMPLGVDYRWYGQLNLYDDQGNFLGSSPDTLSITGTVQVGADTWYVEPDGTGYINKTDGLYRRLSGGQSHLFLKYPVQLTDTWNGDTDLNESFSVLDVDTAITTPAGTFDCVLYRRIRTDRVSGMYYYFYAPQYGLIQYETFYDRTADPLVLQARRITTGLSF